MPIFDIIFLATIVTVFTTFGIVLAGVTWYCSDKRKRPVDLAASGVTGSRLAPM
jgi:hypothetical protein